MVECVLVPVVGGPASRVDGSPGPGFRDCDCEERCPDTGGRSAMQFANDGLGLGKGHPVCIGNAPCRSRFGFIARVGLRDSGRWWARIA